ncbi:MAG TPA: hypothetical protein VGM97_11935, partial [Steroidobacteraceae bacterium]
MMDVFARGRELRQLAPPGLIDLEDRAPWEGLNKVPFAFTHRLAGHPLFTIERLAELSERVFERPDYRRHVRTSLPKEELRRRLREDILSIGTNGQWLSLHYIDEMHKDYADLFESLLVDIEHVTGSSVRRQMEWGSMSVFMNAPGLKVPYHFDHETNFLMQIQGEKEVRLYPPGLATLTLDEIEDFYRYNPMAGRYRDDLATAGQSFILKPGVAVHHPPLAPHLIRNGKEISVSVSLYYVTAEMEDQARVHQANYCLRKLGFRPRPVGSSSFWDGVKSGAMKGISKSKPRTHDEMLYSGIQRIAAPMKLAKRAAQRLHR